MLFERVIRTLVIAIAAICEPQTAHAGGEDVDRPTIERVLLPRTVILPGEREHFMSPLLVSVDRNSSTGFALPASLKEAVTLLVNALPPGVGHATPNAAEASACSKDLVYSAAAIRACRVALCRRLPESDRDNTCNYLGKVGQWTEKAWLGALCLSADWDGSTPLSAWFQQRGVGRCSTMSSALKHALALELSAVPWEAESIAREYAGYDEDPRAAEEERLPTK